MISKKTAAPRVAVGAAKPVARRVRTAEPAPEAALPAAGRAPAVKTQAVKKQAVKKQAVKKVAPARPPARSRIDPATTQVTLGTAAITLTEANETVRKPRAVRDSFTMTEAEYALLGELKQACLAAEYEVKKSELVRVGIALVAQLDIVALKDLLVSLSPVKPRRAKKS